MVALPPVRTRPASTAETADMTALEAEEIRRVISLTAGF